MDHSANESTNHNINENQDQSLSLLQSQKYFKDKLIRCSFRVSQKSIFGYPLISLYDLDGNVILSSQKCVNGKYSEYPLSSSTEFEVSQTGIGCQSKLQMDLDGSMSQIFKSDNTHTEIHGAQYIIPKGLPPGSAPRVVNCGIPTIQWKVGTNGSIIQLLKQKNYSQFLHLTTKPPVLSKNDGRYILEYDDRSIVASRSNFILIDAKDEKQTILLQFGKTGENEYILDFRYPLSPLQAFGLALGYFETSVLQLSSEAWRSNNSSKEIVTPIILPSNQSRSKIMGVDNDMEEEHVNSNVDFIANGVSNQSTRIPALKRPSFTGRTNTSFGIGTHVDDNNNTTTTTTSGTNRRSSVENASTSSRSPLQSEWIDGGGGNTTNTKSSFDNISITTTNTTNNMANENRVLRTRDVSPVKGPPSDVITQESYIAQKTGKVYLLAPATRFKGLIRCDLRRTSQGVLAPPIYSLYTKDGIFLMSACKNSKSEIIITANDLVSGEHNNNNNQEIAKLIYNRDATQFQLFPTQSETIVNNCDILCGVIIRTRGLPPGTNPRQVQVGIPQLGDLDNMLPWKKDTSTKDMIDALKSKDLDHLIYLTNKVKKYEDDKFLLDYDDREIEAYEKNFILTDETDEKLAIVLQYGKTMGSTSCVLDFQYPLSPLQAFAIALSTQECTLPSAKADTKSSKIYTGRVHMSSESWKHNAQTFLNHATNISLLETPMMNTSSMDDGEAEGKVESTNTENDNYRQVIMNTNNPQNKGFLKSRSSSSAHDERVSHSPLQTGYSGSKLEEKEEDDSPRTSCDYLSPTTSSELLTKRSDKLLLTSPIQKYSGLFRCYIMKTQSSMFATPMYHLYWENDDTKLLFAQKSTNRKNKTVYNLTMNNDVVVAKCFPSSDGTLFELLDDSDMYDDSNCCTLAAITIKPRGSPPGRDPRLIRIVSPLLNEEDNITTWKTTTDGEMTQRLIDRDYRNLSHLISRTPLTDAMDSKSSNCAPFVVYDDRAVLPSSKNCVVIDATKREDQNPNTLFQLGNSNVPSKYILDFQYPLSPIQAFAIALSALECKITGAKVSGHSSKLYSGLRHAATEDWTKARSAAEVLYTPTNPQRSSVSTQPLLISENSMRRRTSSQLTDGENSINQSTKSNNTDNNKTPKPPKKLPYQNTVILTDRKTNFNYQPHSQYNNDNDGKENEEYDDLEEGPARTKNWKNKKRYSTNDCSSSSNRNWQQSRNNHNEDNNNLETVEIGVTTSNNEAKRETRTHSLPAADRAWESRNRNDDDDEDDVSLTNNNNNNNVGVSTYHTSSKNNYHYEESFPRDYSPVEHPEKEKQQQSYSSKNTKLWRSGAQYQHSIPQILLQTRLALTDPTNEKEGLLRCVIRRQFTTVLGINPIYLMYTETGQFMMSSQKKRERKFDIYPISLVEHQVVSGGSHYLGKLRCNSEGTHFQLFDDTDNRDDAQCQELSAIAITSCGMPPGRNPRGFQVAMPKLTYNGKIPLWTAANDGDMLKYLRDRRVKKLTKLMSVDAIEFKSEGFALEYDGRGADKSTRNFQLTDKCDSRSIILQVQRRRVELGKNEDASFFLDFKYPLSPIQALALALSSLDSKALGAKVKGIEVNSYRQTDSPNYNIIQSSQDLRNYSERGKGGDDDQDLDRYHNRPIPPRNSIIEDSIVEDFQYSDVESPPPTSPNRKRTSSLNNKSMSPKRVQELRNKNNKTSLCRTTSLPQQEHYTDRRLELAAIKQTASTKFNKNNGRSQWGYDNDDGDNDARSLNDDDDEEEESDVSTNLPNYYKRKLKSVDEEVSIDYYNPLERHHKNLSSSHSSSDYSPVVTRETSPNFLSDRDSDGILDTSTGKYRNSENVLPRGSKIWRTQAPNSTTVRDNIFNIRLILTSPVPKSLGMMRTVVTRTRCKDNPKYKGYIYTMYDMGGEGEGKFMMCSKKLIDKDKKLHSYPISSCETEVQIGGAKYLGKLRRNLDGDQFQIFDDTDVNESKCQQLGALTILPRGFPPGTSPRLIRIGLPLLDDDGNIVSWHANKDTDMLRFVKSKNFQNLTHLRSKHAQQNQQTGEFSLSYDCRDLSKYDSSHKNCIIVKEGEEDQQIILQLGKAGGSLFVLDFQYPLSPFQAFAIALSSIDSKTAGARIKGSSEIFRYSVPDISRKFSSWSSHNSKSMAIIQDQSSLSNVNLNPVTTRNSPMAFESDVTSAPPPPRLVPEQSRRLDPNKEEEEEIKSPEFDKLTRSVVAAAPMIRCYLKRKNYSSLAVFGSPTYTMFTSEDRKFLMTGRLQNKDNTMFFNVTKSETFNTDARHFLGKIISNLDVTAFKIYDNTVTADSILVTDTNVVGAVAISIGSSQAGSLKKIEVCLPAPHDSQRIQAEYEDYDLIFKLNQQEFSNIQYLHSKLPEWNEELGGYSLDFQGRVKLPSAKNFQLVLSNDTNTVMLQFGKVDQDTFNLDFRHPLTSFQAFAIAICICMY